MISSAIADSIRRAIPARLIEGETPVTEPAEPFDIALPAVMKHIRVPEDSGQVTREKEGRISPCRLSAAPLEKAADWINYYEQFRKARLDALETHLGKRHGRNCS